MEGSKCNHNLKKGSSEKIDIRKPVYVVGKMLESIIKEMVREQLELGSQHRYMKGRTSESGVFAPSEVIQ